MTCNKFVIIYLLFTLAAFQGCYSLSGVSIGPDVNTYFVVQFRSNAANAPPTLEQTLTEALKEKIRTESRLVLDEIDPDVDFSGTVVDYRVTSEAPQPGELTAIVEYTNHREEGKNWRSNFSFFFDFPSSQDLASVQNEAIQAITTQLVEDIFNKAFTDW